VAAQSSQGRRRRDAVGIAAINGLRWGERSPAKSQGASIVAVLAHGVNQARLAHYPNNDAASLPLVAKKY